MSATTAPETVTLELTIPQTEAVYRLLTMAVCVPTDVWKLDGIDYEHQDRLTPLAEGARHALIDALGI